MLMERRVNNVKKIRDSPLEIGHQGLPPQDDICMCAISHLGMDERERERERGFGNLSQVIHSFMT